MKKEFFFTFFPRCCGNIVFELKHASMNGYANSVLICILSSKSNTRPFIHINQDQENNMIT